MQLNDFPRAICDLQYNNMGIQINLDDVTKQISSAHFEIDLEISFDASLKNDSQRKAAKLAKIKSNEVLLKLESQAAQLKRSLMIGQFALEQLRNEFEIAKLMMQYDMILLTISHRLALTKTFLKD